MWNERALRRGRNIAGGLSIAAMLSVCGVPAAFADVTPQKVDPVQHFADCLHAMLSDSAEHAAACSPSAILPDTQTLTSVGGGNSCDPPPLVENNNASELIVPLRLGQRVLVAVNCEPLEQQ